MVRGLGVLDGDGHGFIHQRELRRRQHDVGYHFSQLFGLGHFGGGHAGQAQRQRKNNGQHTRQFFHGETSFFI